jgi:hypothetical protein
LASSGGARWNTSLVVAFEHALDLLAKGAVSVEARDLVFVLVGEQLRVVACDSLSKFRRIAFFVFYLFYFKNKRSIPLCVSSILIASQELRAPLDEFLEVARDVLLDRNHFRRDRHAPHALQVHRCAPAPDKGVLVEGDRDAVQLDRALDGFARRAAPSPSACVAEHEHVGAMESPIRAVAISAAGTNSRCGPPQASWMSCCRFEPGSCQSGFLTKAAVGVCGVHQRASLLRVHLVERVSCSRDHQVAADDQARVAGAEARDMYVGRTRGDLHVRHHRRRISARVGHIQHRHAFFLQVRRHAEDLADSDTASAADAGD